MKTFSLDHCLFHCSFPIEKHISKKNNRPVVNGHLIKSAKLRNAEKYLIEKFTYYKNMQKIEKPFNEPLWLIMHFIFPREDYYTKQSKYTQRSKFVPDLSNMYEIVQDCLQSAGVIKDDALVESHDLSRRLVGREMRLEVFLLKYEP